MFKSECVDLFYNLAIMFLRPIILSEHCRVADWVLGANGCKQPKMVDLFLPRTNTFIYLFIFCHI